MKASEARCHLLGDLAARAAAQAQPDLGQWSAIEQTLAGRPGFLRRRWLVLAFPALAGLALWIGAGQTLGHVSQGCTLGPDGSFSVPDARECTVTFDEGTRITLGKASSGRLHKLGFRSGARLDLDKGHAALSVVHRLLGRWQVLAGPFAVRVTGTKFEVDWAPGQGRFGLMVGEGKVRASGGPLRDRTVSAGHRIEVDTATGRVIARRPDPAHAASCGREPGENRGRIGRCLNPGGSQRAQERCAEQEDSGSQSCVLREGTNCDAGNLCRHARSGAPRVDRVLGGG